MINELGKMSFDFDKSNWMEVNLGQLANEVSKRVENPSLSKFGCFVGLEHFDSGNLKIERFGSTSNLVSATKAFAKGNILFARRNAYLRRASLVSFDGVCSGDAFVLQENHDLIEPGLLALIVNSSNLWDFANSNAAGTMSKRVKWRDLAGYELKIPPLTLQKEISNVIWALDKLLDNYNKTSLKLRTLVKYTFLNELFADVNEKEDFDIYFQNLRPKFEVCYLGDALQSLQYGISESLSTEQLGGIPVLRMNNLQGGAINTDDLKYFKPKNDELNKFILNKGDILFNRTNSYDLVGKTSLFEEEGEYSFASYLIRLKTKEEKLNSKFANLYLNSSIGLAKVRKYRTPGVSQCNINAQNLKKVPIPLPSLKKQMQIVQKIELLESPLKQLEQAINSTKGLREFLINKVF